ncbi:MAG: DUF983 domain-containing protein [Bernardetiaceae bacterium]|nr:DUF983 domain-containing protein [Bernardetiaceae bacterium]
MNKTCSECGLYYEREPGFFWGAMYISYGFAIATVLTAFAIMTILVDHVKLWQYFVAIFVPLFIIAPFAFRYSRVLMLYLFAGVSYDKDAIEKNEDKIKQEKIN